MVAKSVWIKPTSLILLISNLEFLINMSEKIEQWKYPFSHSKRPAGLFNHSIIVVDIF